MLVHYYYGSRENAVYTALGSAIRAKGHKFTVNILIVESPTYVLNPAIFNDFGAEYISTYSELEKHIMSWLSINGQENKRLYIIVNFDEIYVTLTERNKLNLIKNIRNLALKAEVILTGEKEIEELIKYCDYVSRFSNQ